MSSRNGVVNTIERQRNGNNIIESSKAILRRSANIVGENESKMIAEFRDNLVEVYFSGIQPLMVIRLVKLIEVPDCYEAYKLANDMNKDCIYGFHCFDIEKKRYYFQTTQWLQSALSSKTFYEMLKVFDAETKKFLEIIENQ